jgi:hypothetical protein
LPLSEKTRIEVYIPDRKEKNYQNLLDVFADEFTEAFDGCTIVRGLEGRYLNDEGGKDIESMNMLYADLPLELEIYTNEVSLYVNEIKSAAHEVLEEESILVTVRTIYHAE